MQKFIYILLLNSVFFSSLFAQDSHYWNLQYGSKSMLLGGVLTSGFYDNSAVYYNPAALAFVNYSHVSINATAYRYEALRLKNGGGENIDLNSNRFSTYPQMVSNMLTHNPDARLKVGLMIFTRNSSQIDITNLTRLKTDVLAQSPGEEDYFGNYDYQNLVNEPWAGVGLGYKINENISIGWSTFLSYRNQRYLINISAKAASATADELFLSAYQYRDELRINNLKFVNKIGVHANYEGWRIGLNFTLPSWQLAGWSRIKREMVFQDLPNHMTGILIDQQKGVKTNYRYPWSLAFGVSHKFKKAWVGINMEYFDNIGAYRMISATTRNIAYPSNLNYNVTDFLSYYNYANAVFNVGIAAEFNLNDAWTLQGSFRTDNTYHRKPTRGITPDMNIVQSPNYNLYHTTFGFSLRRKASLMTLGLCYSYGHSNNAMQLVNFSHPVYENNLLGYVTEGNAMRSHSITIMTGYTYFFALK